MAVNVEDAGFILKDCIMWLYGSGFPKATDISKQLDKKAGAKREIIGKQKNKSGIGNKNCEHYTVGGTKAIEINITAPSTEPAKLWNGWKSHGLKPAYEPILVAVKPNDGTYANNALKWGVSGLWIDGGRIGTDVIPAQKRGNAVNTDFMSGGFTPERTGRFPANIIHDGLNGEEWSRYFYCAKASRSERNLGCDEIKKREKAQLAGANNDKPIEELDDVSKRYRSKPMSNIHPTVKPLKLIEYLCKLTKTPTGGIVLDPFCGSGTTCIAAYKTGRKFIGFDREKEYCEIAEARVKHHMEKNEDDKHKIK